MQRHGNRFDEKCIVVCIGVSFLSVNLCKMRDFSDTHGLPLVACGGGDQRSGEV